MHRTARFGLCLALALMVAAPAAWASEHEGGESAASAAAKLLSSDRPIFVKMNSINIPIIRKNGTTGMLALDIIAQVKNEDAKEKVEMYRPKLRDTFIRVLYGNLQVNNLLRSDGALDMDRLKSRLLKSTNYVMKEPAITDILFNGVNHRAF